MTEKKALAPFPPPPEKNSLVMDDFEIDTESQFFKAVNYKLINSTCFIFKRK